MKPKRILTILLSLIATLSISAKEQIWSAENIKMVHLEDARRYVCDPDDIMDKEWRDSTDAYLGKLHHELGVQSVFIIVNRVKDEDAFRMAQDVGNQYGVGTKKDRKGLIVVIAVEDHKYFIAPGKGLEGDLTDVECNDIAKATIVKNMRNDNPTMAVYETVKAIYTKLRTGKTGISDIDQADEWTTEDTVIAIIIALIIFCVPILMFVSWILSLFGIKWPKTQFKNNSGRRNKNDDFPPFFMGGGSSHSGSSGISHGSFGGGSFGGGGSGGSW